jgi:hypothetical protein
MLGQCYTMFEDHIIIFIYYYFYNLDGWIQDIMQYARSNEKYFQIGTYKTTVGMHYIIYNFIFIV